MNDRVFLKLARKVGYPTPVEVAKLRMLQVERARKGAEPSLRELARGEGVLSPKQTRNYDRWAEQIAAKAKVALVEDEDPAPLSGTVSGRVVAQSAEEVIEKDDEPAASVDDLISKLERDSTTPDLEDRVFLKLARKVGYPSTEDVSRLRKLQGKGEDLSLFRLARNEKVFTAKEQKNYDRWAGQIAAKAKAALVEDEVPLPAPSGRIVVLSAEELAVVGEEATADLDTLIAKLEHRKASPVLDLADRVFLKLAKRVGYPSPEEVSKLRKRQVAEKGEDLSLFRIAREEKLFSTKQQKNYDRWAAQIEAKAKAALVEDEESAPLPGTVSGRIIVPSVDELEITGEEAKADLDDMIARFSKRDEPAAKPPVRPGGKLRTASAGRERVATKGPRTAKNPGGAIAAVAVAVVAFMAIVIAASGSSTPEPLSEPVASAPRPVVKPLLAAVQPTDLAPSPRPLGSGVADATDEMDQKAQARALLEQARALLEQGDTDGARSCVEEARGLDPACPGLDEVARKIPARETPRPEAAPEAPEKVVKEPAPEPGATPAPPAEPTTPGKEAKPRPGEPVIERTPDGKVKAKYGTDARGRRQGEYVEFHENGKPSVRAHYLAGQLDGAYGEFWPSGKPRKKAAYRKDRLHGRVIEWDAAGVVAGDALWQDGELIYPRSAALISSMLAEIDRSPVDAPAAPKDRKVEFAPMDAQAQARPLRRLRQHRWIAGVPWDVDLSFEYGEWTSAAARMLDLIGHLEHTPKKPGGCSDSLYEAGYKGTSQGNLFEGVSDLIQCIDGWMDDSDPSNIDRVGHRRWCLNPPMKKTAIGQFASKWTALHAHDRSRTGFDEPSIVRYPAQGLFPATHIRADAAWSISLNDKFQAPIKEEVKVSVRPCDERLKKGAPLELDYFNVNNDGFGQPFCVIFRMKGISHRSGSGYWVDVKGLKEADGKPYPLGYYVEFFDPGR